MNRKKKLLSKMLHLRCCRGPRSISELKGIKYPVKDTCHRNPIPWRYVSQILHGHAVSFH